MLKLNKMGQGNLLMLVLASCMGSILISSLTNWYLSMNKNMTGTNDRLEAMTIAMSEWQRLEHMSLDELEANRENYKTPYNVGDKFKVGIVLGEQGYFDKGTCNSLAGDYASESANCFKDTTMTVYDKDGNAMYTTRSLPLSVGGTTFPEGTILPYTGDLAKIPRGWVLCDGSNGTPDLRGRFLEGTSTETGKFKDAGLPNLTGSLGAENAWARIMQPSGGTNPFYIGRGVGSLQGIASGGGDAYYEVLFNASRQNSLYGKADTVQPKSFTVFYIMKTNTDFHYEHTNGFVSPEYYTKADVDKLLQEQEEKYKNLFLAIDSKKYIHNDTSDYLLSMGYNAIDNKVKMFVDGIEKKFGDSVPVGTIMPFNGKTSDIPSGWYICDGTNGTPDLRDKFLMSYGKFAVGDFVEAGLPNLVGQGGLVLGASGVAGSHIATGVFSKTKYNRDYPIYAGDGSNRGFIYFDASSYNSIYGNSETVQPPAYIVCYIIKMA